MSMTCIWVYFTYPFGKGVVLWCTWHRRCRNKKEKESNFTLFRSQGWVVLMTMQPRASPLLPRVIFFVVVLRRTNNQEKPQLYRPSLLINRATPWERGQRLTASLNPPTCSLHFLIDADRWEKNCLLPISEGTVDPDMHDSRAYFPHASWFCTFLRLCPPSGGKICFWRRAGFCLWTLTRSPFVRSDAK